MVWKIATALLVLLMRSLSDCAELPLICVASQYVQLGRRGTVQCASKEPLFEVHWYNSTKYQNTPPIIYIKELRKGGYGYESGEFDINLNGSLTINNVTMGHDHTFTAVALSSPEDEVVPIFVNVLVIGTTSESRHVLYRDSTQDSLKRRKNVGAIITGVLLLLMGAIVAAGCFKSCNRSEYDRGDACSGPGLDELREAHLPPPALKH